VPSATTGSVTMEVVIVKLQVKFDIKSPRAADSVPS
jgi:hypothetical protein